MKIPKLLTGLEFVGQVEGDRRTYYVLRGEHGYLVASLGNNGGINISVVDLEAADVIQRKFGGQRVTSKKVVADARRPDLFGARFAALNALYVMAASRKAKKLVRKEGRSIVFKIKDR